MLLNFPMTELLGKLLTRMRTFSSGSASEQDRELGRVVGIADLPRAIGPYGVESLRDILEKGIVAISRG